MDFPSSSLTALDVIYTLSPSSLSSTDALLGRRARWGPGRENMKRAGDDGKGEGDGGRKEGLHRASTEIFRTLWTRPSIPVLL